MGLRTTVPALAEKERLAERATARAKLARDTLL